MSALLFVGASLSGCAAHDPFEDWSDVGLAERVEQMSRSDKPTDVGLPLHTDIGDGLAGVGAIDTYIAAALSDNPDIKAAQQRVERLRERIPQAKALPDPMATFTFGELAQTAAGQVDYIVGVQQSLPFPGTLDARGELARQEVVAALHAMRAVVDEVTGDVRRAYWSYDGAIREIEVLEESRSLLTQIDSAVSARVRVGNASQADLLRISREIAALENQIAEVRRRQQTASAMLARLTSRPVPESWPRGEDSRWQKPGFDADSLKRLAEQGSPKVAEAQARVQAFHRQYKLARRDRKPDFMVGFQYGAVRAGGLAPSANGDDQIAGTVGVSIPLWTDRYDAAEREALRGMGESLAQVRAAQDRVAYQIDEAACPDRSGGPVA
ncbi:MAG: TolC family protein [Phycisphaerales bacterium]